LQRIAEKASKEAKFKFTSLFHLMNEELLLVCYWQLNDDAAAGIDKLTGLLDRKKGKQKRKTGSESNCF
ncbi:MAG: hypothetical protein QNL62_03420, partial [Gammaproteobacteria bacterium]|nr:hypothetical protein [Gammaproteobacteria bacterium]